jgi:hypothetical protein
VQNVGFLGELICTSKPTDLNKQGKTSPLSGSRDGGSGFDLIDLVILQIVL